MKLLLRPPRDRAVKCQCTSRWSSSCPSLVNHGIVCSARESGRDHGLELDLMTLRWTQTPSLSPIVTGPDQVTDSGYSDY